MIERLTSVYDRERAIVDGNRRTSSVNSPSEESHIRTPERLHCARRALVGCLPAIAVEHPRH